MRRVRQAVAATLTLAALATACSASSEPAEPGALGHVHDLAVVDGRLLAATHAGLFEIVDGRAHAIGEGRHDLMAFTAGVDGELLASGHPDLSSEELRAPGRPPLLGLIGSIDGGRTWEPRALLGEVDFHALTVDHDAIAGIDGASESMLVSSDGDTWDVRGDLAGQDLAADPTDPEAFVAVLYDGELTQSRDGGRSWTAVDAPPLSAIEWHRNGLVGLGPDGEIQVSDRPEGTWTRIADLDGTGEALLVTEGSWFAAVEGPAVLSSNDAGRTWQTLLAPASP